MYKVKKIFVVGTQTFYTSFIRFKYKLTDKLQDADIVIFTGGEDVDPKYYNEEKHYTTYSNYKRDAYEEEIFKMISPNQLVIGICRGSQFLCVMNGGKLVQDVTDHAIYYTHPIYNDKDECLYITSTHHQMQFPYRLNNNDYDVLYYAKGLSQHYEGIKDLTNDEKKLLKKKEPEIVLYHKENKPKCLAIQGHPEMLSITTDAVIKINELIKNLLN